MDKFNLRKHLFDSRYAMGSTRQQNREDYTWWDYENLVSEEGKDWEDFRLWLERDSSLTRALEESRYMRSEYFWKVKRAFKLSNSEVPLILKTYVGYHPAYGGYIMNIGPYFGNLGTSRNRFSYFTKKIRRSTQKEIENSLELNMKKYMDAYGVELEDGDFQFVLVKHPEWDPKREKQERKTVVEVVNSLDPESPEGRDFYSREPMVNPNSKITLNSRGYEKLLRKLWGPQYREVIAEKSASEGKTTEQVLTEAVSSFDVLQEIYRQIKNKYEEAVEQGQAVGLEPPPRFLDLSLGTKGSGQLRPSGIEKTSHLFIRGLEFQKEVLALLVEGVTNPEEIKNRLNADSRRRGHEVGMEEVNDKLEDISDMNPDGSKSYEQLLSEVQDAINGYSEVVGFSSLSTAFNMAKLYFTHLPVDPKTGSKKGMRYLEEVQTIPLDMEKNFVDVNEEQLEQFRHMADESQLNIEEATDEDIERELGRRLNLPNIADYEKVKPPESPEAEEAVIEEPAETKESIEDEDEDENVYVPSLKDLLGNTFKNLIKIATELDDDGKSEAAEEVHKLLRKYEKDMRR